MTHFVALLVIFQIISLPNIVGQTNHLNVNSDDSNAQLNEPVLQNQNNQTILKMNDPLFPGRGKSMLTLATGIPYLGIGEYAYGFSNRFSAGLIFGRTPFVNGYGIRLRLILIQKEESFRFSLRAPIFYYQGDEKVGKEPWALGWLTGTAEWKLQNGIRLSGGLGMVGTECIDDIFGFLGTEHEHEESHETAEEHVEEGGMGKIWNTVHIGFSCPIAKRIVFQSEVSLVADGWKIAGSDWVGGIPVIATLGIAYSL